MERGGQVRIRSDSPGSHPRIDRLRVGRRVRAFAEGHDLRRTIAVALLSMASHAASSPASRAELVYFAGGGEAHVPLSSSEGTIRIAVAGRSFEFLEGDFRRIAPDHWPEHEWERRRVAALAGGAESCYAAA